MAERRKAAQRLAKSHEGSGRVMSPVAIEGRTIAHTFWGKAWCESVDFFSDYANRLPRGKRYARNGSVIDLQITRGAITALVSGSSVYNVRIEIAEMAPARWGQLCRQCSGSVASAVELLQGKLDRAVMSQMSSRQSGLFPEMREVRMSCSCPDSATLCKHVAAVLYGVGARLDGSPQLLFQLRGVDIGDLVSAAVSGDAITEGKRSGRRKLNADAIGAVFDIDLGVDAAPASAGKAAKTARVEANKTQDGTARSNAQRQVTSPASSKKAGKTAAHGSTSKASGIKAKKPAHSRPSSVSRRKR